MAGASDVQVGRSVHKERRWGAGINKRAGSEKVNEQSRKDRGKRWGIRDRLKVLSISDKSLGAEGSMSKVGIPPPHK